MRRVSLGQVFRSRPPCLWSSDDQVAWHPIADVAGITFGRQLRPRHVTALQTLARARQTPGAGHSAGHLASLLRPDPLQVEPIIAVLIDLGWVARLEEDPGDDGPRLVLLSDLARTSLAPLLQQTLLDPDEWTQRFWHQAGLDAMTLQDALDLG